MVGRVYLVGAGPGDPGLLTLKGRDALARADLVLYDGLVNPILLRHTSARAERTARAAGPHGPRIDQPEINARLIAAAREGKTVVRLKGGDPFIFGRGSEEAAALAAAGIPFEVVPGITAATAAAVYAGISLTHRDHASAVAFVTGHEDPTRPSALDYGELAKFPGTLVFYMGLDNLERIAARLIASGKPADTPAAVVSRATTPGQRTVAGTLAELPRAVASAGLHPPSLIIVGECVRQREQIDWFEQRPLLGRTIGVTRPDHQCGPQIERIWELGAEPVVMPLIRIAPPDDWSDVDRALDRMAEYDWLVLSSANGVEALLGRLWQTGGDARRLGQTRIACIGPATAAALAAFQLRADLTPTAYRAESLAAALTPHVAGKQVLWARASRGRDVLPTELRRAGAIVEELVVYQNLDVETLASDVARRIETGPLDWIGLSSPSIATRLAALVSSPARARLGTETRLAAISPVTAEAAAAAGLPVAAVAETFTWDGLVDAIVRAEAGTKPSHHVP